MDEREGGFRYSISEYKNAYDLVRRTRPHLCVNIGTHYAEDDQKMIITCLLLLYFATAMVPPDFLPLAKFSICLLQLSIIGSPSSL